VSGCVPGTIVCLSVCILVSVFCSGLQEMTRITAIAIKVVENNLFNMVLVIRKIKLRKYSKSASIRTFSTIFSVREAYFRLPLGFLILSSMARPDLTSTLIPSDNPVLMKRFSNFCGATSIST